MPEKLKVGVVAIQGDFEAHAKCLASINCEPVRVLWKSDLAPLSALILPGGESTTISRGLTRQSLYQPIRDFVATGRPVLGTCAGAILLASRVVARESDSSFETIGALNVTAVRNAYGTQVDSFSSFPDLGTEKCADLQDLKCVFIRAPKLIDLGSEVEVLLRVKEAPVLVRQGKVLAATFHPELTLDTRVHVLLLSLVKR